MVSGEFERRSKMTVYKVLRGEVYKENGTMKARDTTVICEGLTLEELEKRFPRKYFTNGNSMDELRNISKPGSKILHVFFVRENDTEEWKPVLKDPREFLVAHPHGDPKAAVEPRRR